jgi:hypothetical protein
MRKQVCSMAAGALVLLSLGMVTLSGCIEGRSNVTYGPKGPPIGHRTLKQIEVGQTSKAWLLGTLGEPTRETQTPEGTDILTYEYTKKIDSDFEFCIFLDFDDQREERTVYVFELTNGIVTRYWKE